MNKRTEAQTTSSDLGVVNNPYEKVVHVSDVTNHSDLDKQKYDAVQKGRSRRDRHTTDGTVESIVSLRHIILELFKVNRNVFSQNAIQEAFLAIDYRVENIHAIEDSSVKDNEELFK
ncbi:hypothetical protein CEXT_163641 [Caerostris extrusa]|uniref:Uncharacterized protein n=1 Tax=Caerostris extrusa TaxID=172846 RepID=A0AAV4T9Q7_CAEEX|nr:hypothetical protein CEXT_163641 [Caerostris extrusa]